ncbi:putative MFS family arabinose efflux permease [Microbacterium sp. SLBN-154]|uniref:MFS transporter n=1 Tax=Microbacterium sp. SLBN-154 TaxID=2768458 RepID=UPI00115007D0|nr:MFS transporter [Microbacterium sp. SLBN-154]TQK18108.1 putative MFS family arabinose efflux permease [Microbacterium sp. SLBN-154]
MSALDSARPTATRPVGTPAVLVAQLLIRSASAAGALALGAYFVDLARAGAPVGALILGVLSGLSFLAELVLAPLAGSASDRRGRRVFLVAAPLLAAAGILITPGASLIAVAPSAALVIAVVATSRLLDGAGAAIAAPATLGLLADASDDDRMRRGRVTSLYELSSSGGIAVGAVIGPLLYGAWGLWSFVALAAVYVVASLLVLLFVRPDAAGGPSRLQAGVRERIRIIGQPRLLAFLPAWIAVNAILGTWVTSQITFVLAGDRTADGQLLPGAFAGNEVGLSAVLGVYVLVFSLCIVAWAFFIGRLPTVPTLFVTVAGAIVASIGLLLLNHGVSLAIAIPIVVAGMFLEAGFTPAALTHLSDISSEFRENRGLIMGVYSVVVGAGYLLGNVLGGVFAEWLLFDGLAILTIGLAVVAMASILVMAVIERRMVPRVPGVTRSS